MRECVCVTERVEDVKGSLKPAGSWKTTVIIVFAVIAVSLCALIGYVIYVKSQQTSRKRLY